MPYRIVHESKPQPHGRQWCVEYKKGGKWIRIGCTTSKERAKRMIRAIEARKHDGR